ncbi:hypothetical protein CR513_55166, partial [Mucuna pruriens]
MSKAKWAKHLGEATGKSIRWYLRWNERDDIIIRCGGFPNVSMMGTQGAINYNPKLLPRQAGYPMALPPPEEAISPFIIHDLGIQDGGCHRNIWQAWRSVVRKGPEWGARSCSILSSCLTFEDPRLNASGKPRSNPAGPHGPLERKSYDNLAHTSGRGQTRKPAKRAGLGQQSKKERDQALAEKEELKTALVESQKKEAELSQLQEKAYLLEDESARARLQSKHLENQRRKMLAELVEERAKTIEVEIQAEAAT